MNGSHSQLGTPRHYQDPKPMVQQQHYPPGQKPQIYTAVYSGVSVYEMEINGLAVMRRRADSWLNATQILKLAGIDKGKRTKVLEKEILSGDHEKVQGGYGKYQGTWVSYNRGVDFARGYGVEEPLRPLLEYDMGQDGVSLAGSGNMATPTKEQAMAAQRKRNMMNGSADNRAPAQSPNGTFFKNLSKSAANAVNAISKARFDSPGPRPASGGRSIKPVRRASQQLIGSQGSAYAGSSQQSMQSLHSENSFGNCQLDPALRAFNTPYYDKDHKINDEEPPRKRIKASSGEETTTYDSNGVYDASMRDISPPEGSFAYPQGASQSNLDYTLVGLAPLKQPSNGHAQEEQQMLSSLFFDSSQTDFSDHPALLRLSGEELDIPIDQTAHTALHWAATLARTSLLRALVNKGANIYRLNGGGETALIRAALTTNNLDQGSFPELLELLGPTIEIRDGRGRTVLHHIAVSSAVKGPKRSSACRYYLESLLEYVVRSGSATNSQANSFQDVNGAQAPKSIGLARFMSEIVNATDLSGDTALNLAARIGNKSIIQQLLEVGANPTIANRGGLRPVDFGVAGGLNVAESEPSGQISKAHDTPISRVAETSRDLVNTLKSFVSENSSSFNAQMQSKQSLIDQTHAKLRDTTSLLNEEHRRVSDLQRRADERKALRQHIRNLRQANEQQRAFLSNRGSTEVRTDIKVGEADAGLEIDAAILPLSMLDQTQPLNLNPAQSNYIHTLPTSAVLRARSNSYRRINAELEVQTKVLQSQSSELEAKLRKVVALCTGVQEERVDETVEGLCKAVESEEGDEVEVGRVREFLRRVEVVEG
ncbi:MAG: hypothetical protein Q9217_002509 [Psora testacea]